MKTKASISLSLAVLIVIVVQVIVMATHVFSDLKVKNEFMYLDQKTILNDGSVVSNAEFEAQNLVINEVNLNYIKTPSSLNIFSKTGINIKDIPDFFYFSPKFYGDMSHPVKKINYPVNMSQRLLVLNPYQDKAVAYFYSPLFEFFYGKCKNIESLRISRDRHLMHSPKNGTVLDSKNLEDCREGQLSNLVFPILQAEDDVALERKLDFVAKNFNDKILQTLDRHYFHEAPFILAPINEIRLGKPLKEVFSQYGYLSILAISVTMDAIGGFSFPNYEKAIKFSYLLYHAIFLIVVLTIFKQPTIRAGAILIYSLGFFANTYYFYEYAPGHSPIRHFFDFCILLCVWRFDQGRNINFFLFAGAMVVLSIFMDRDYGMLMAAAYIGASVYYSVYRWFEGAAGRASLLFATLLMMVAFPLALKLYPLAPNPSSVYFMDGFYSFTVPITAFLIVLFSILLQALVVLLYGRSLFQQGRLFIFLFAAFYSQLLYFYFVWGGGHAHFFVLLSLYILPYLLLLDLVEWQASLIRRVLARFSLTVVIMAIFVYSFNFFQHYRYTEQTFKDHKVYRWDLPRARDMVTKIDPSLFEDSVQKIKNHAPGKQISMLSKYDSLLAILAEKYSSLPFFELRSMIVTEDDYLRVREQLVKSDLLFIDNDINRDFDKEMNQMVLWNLLPNLFIEHHEQRIPKLKVLQRLYQDVVVDKYVLIERGRLISVYRRKLPA